MSFGDSMENYHASSPTNSLWSFPCGGGNGRLAPREVWQFFRVGQKVSGATAFNPKLRVGSGFSRDHD